MKRSYRNLIIGCTAGLLITTGASAAEGKAGDMVNITAGLPYVDVDYHGKSVRIERNQDTKNRLTNSFSQTSRKCPPFCVQPMNVAPGVTTVGEIELLDFVVTKVKRGDGILMDSRVPSFYKKGTIPGSVNMPFTIFTKDRTDPELSDALKTIGVVEKDIGVYDFTNAKDVLMWCNGAWCGQSPRAIKGLLSLGFPAEKISWYRGGMQMWQVLGMKTVEGN